MTQSNFAALLGLNPATLSQILTGKANPSLNHVEAIRKGFPNISYEWLIAGAGPMFKVDPQQNRMGAGIEQSLFTDDGQSNVPTQAPQMSAPASKSEKKQAALYEPVPSKFEIRKSAEEPDRKVKEIVIYYTNNTFETFVPKH